MTAIRNNVPVVARLLVRPAIWTVFWIAITGFLLVTYARVYADFWSNTSFTAKRDLFTIPLNIPLRNGGKAANVAAGGTVFPVS